MNLGQFSKHIFALTSFINPADSCVIGSASPCCHWCPQAAEHTVTLR